MSCSCTGNCDLINIENLVLSDTFHTWYDRTNEIIDAVNPIQVYDVNVGLTDGGLTAQSTCIGGNANGVITLKVQPGPGIGVGTTVTPNYYLNHTMIDVSNMTILGATGYSNAIISERALTAFPSNNDWFVVSDSRDSSLGSGAGTPKRIKAEHILPPTVYLPYGFQFNGDVSINGNLSIQGTQSNIDSNDLTIEDKLIELAYHRLVTIDVTGPTATGFPAPGMTFNYYDAGVGSTAAYTTVGQISEVDFRGAITTLKLHDFTLGGVNDIAAGGRLSITGTIFDFTMSAGPTTTNAFYTDTQLGEAGLLIHGTDSDKSFVWVNQWGPDSTSYKAFLTNTSLGVSGTSNAIISTQFKAFGYGSSNQNNNKFHFVGNNGAAPTIRLGGLGTGSDQYGYWGISRQNYGLTGAQQPLVFTFKPYAATGEFTSFTVWSGASGSTFPTTTVNNFAQSLNVDLLDGAHGTTVPTPWSIPISLGGGKIDPGWVDTTSITKCYTVVGHSFRVGDVVRMNPDNGSLTGAIATSRQNAEVLGVVSTVSDANNFCIVTKGFISGFTASPGSNINAIFPLVTGNAYFLSADNQGRMIADPDVGIEFGEVRKPIMVAMGGNSAYIHNYLGVVEGDETDIVDVQGLNPIGMIMPFSGSVSNIPYGWLLCDGSRMEKSLWGDLFGAVGNQYFADATISPIYNPSVGGNVPLLMVGGNRGIQVNDAVTIEGVGSDGRDYSFDSYVTAVTTSTVTVFEFNAVSLMSVNLKIRGRTDTNTVTPRTSVFFLPDLRRRVLIGATQGLTGGLTPDVGVGDIGGQNEQILTAENIPPHSHRLSTKGQVQTVSGGAGGFSTSLETDSPSVGTEFTALGPVGVASAAAFDNMQEFLAVHWIIRARKGLAAMIISGHNHDDRYIRYDASQTLSSLNRATFRNNAKVLRNDGDDTFHGDLSVTGSVSINSRVNTAYLNVTGGAMVFGSLTAADATINGNLAVTGGALSIVKSANNVRPLSQYTPTIDNALKWSGANLYVVGGTQFSTAINLFNNNSLGANTSDEGRMNFFGVANTSLDEPRYAGSVGISLRGAGTPDEFGSSIPSGHYENRIGFNIAGVDSGVHVDESALIITRRSDAGIGNESIKYRLPKSLPAANTTVANSTVVINPNGELRKTPIVDPNTRIAMQTWNGTFNGTDDRGTVVMPPNTDANGAIFTIVSNTTVSVRGSGTWNGVLSVRNTPSGDTYTTFYPFENKTTNDTIVITAGTFNSASIMIHAYRID